MSMLTQGTQLFAVLPSLTVPGLREVHEIACIKAFNPGGAPRDTHEDTCLSETKAKTFKRGLATPGQASVTLDADARNPSHLRLHNLASDDSEDSESIDWIIGWSDGVDIAPTFAPAGSLLQITVATAGSGYTSAPSVAISGGGGSGATATAQIEDGKVVGVTVTNSGSGYTSAPTVAFSGGSGTGATAAAQLSAGDINLPSTRTWYSFKGFVTDFPLDFAAVGLVTSTATIQRSGVGTWTKKQA